MINFLSTCLIKFQLVTCRKFTQDKIYLWIWWKLSKRCLAHVCREWTNYEKVEAVLNEVQGLNLEQGAIDFDLQMQISLGTWQIYTALSGVRTFHNLYCIWKFKKSAIKVNKDGLLEYERLKQNDLFSTVKRNAIWDETVTVLVHNVRSLPRHVDNIISDDGIINNNIIGLTETQSKPSDTTIKIIETLNLFNINFNNN